MSRKILSLILLFVLSATTTMQTAAFTGSEPNNKNKVGFNNVERSSDSGTRNESATAFRPQLPLTFEANRGQHDNPDVNFIARTSAYSLFLEPSRAVFVLPGNRNAARELNSSSLRMSIVGATDAACVEARGLQPQAGKANYFVGGDSSRWQTNVEAFSNVEYRNVYAGIDLLYYGNDNRIEYDFVVSPGVDYKQIRMRFKGARKVAIEPQTGDLLIYTRHGVLREHRPFV